MAKEPYQGLVTYNPGEYEEENKAPFAVEDNDTSNYVGVDPIYQNYANETEKPIKADEPDEAPDEEDEEKKEEEPTRTATTTSTSPTPPQLP
jgi:hypothetical protein